MSPFYCSVFQKRTSQQMKLELVTLQRAWDDSPTQCRSELECDEDFLGTAGRREVQLAHKQEAAEATNTMGLPVYPPRYPMISHFTHSHLSLSSRLLLLILHSRVVPLAPAAPRHAVPNSAHVPQSTSSSAPNSSNQNKKWLICEGFLSKEKQTSLMGPCVIQ